jgi:hypothetical protein
MKLKEYLNQEFRLPLYIKVLMSINYFKNFLFMKIEIILLRKAYELSFFEIQYNKKTIIEVSIKNLISHKSDFNL